jgi:hypothetical protein
MIDSLRFRWNQDDRQYNKVSNDQSITDMPNLVSYCTSKRANVGQIKLRLPPEPKRRETILLAACAIQIFPTIRSLDRPMHAQSRQEIDSLRGYQIYVFIKIALKRNLLVFIYSSATRILRTYVHPSISIVTNLGIVVGGIIGSLFEAMGWV